MSLKSLYDELIDAIDEYREAKNDDHKEVGYDPHGYEERRRKDRRQDSILRLNHAFCELNKITAR